MKRQVVLIKLGGSIITNKLVEQSVEYEVLRSLVKQITQIREQKPNLHIIIAHGQGSFAHFPVKKYRLHEGFVDDNATYGCAVALDVVAKLNRIIIGEMLKAKLPAVSLFPSQISVAADGKPHSSYFSTLDEYLRLGLLPVLTGDVIADTKRGSVIWSADFLLPYLARHLSVQGWNIHSLIHITKTPGVFKDVAHPDLGVFAKITPSSFKTISQQLGGSHGVDVTGGMLEKVRESIELAKEGFETVITNNDQNNLIQLLVNNQQVGTRVTSSRD